MSTNKALNDSPMASGDAAIRQTVERLQTAFGAAPDVAVVLGTGWAEAGTRLTGAQTLPCAELPAFPQPRVEGHVAEVVMGCAGPRRVLMLRGRSHTYETGDCSGMAGAIRSLKDWGCRSLVLTNAAGSLRPHMPTGSLMLISDHINAPQRSPLVGALGPQRFVDMGHAYDPPLRAHAHRIAADLGVQLGEGVYVWALGPQFETPAEIRMFAAWGADAVGMSTVPETILARHAGLRVLGLSLMTNMAAGLSDEVLSHAHTMQQAQAAGQQAADVLARLLATWPD